MSNIKPDLVGEKFAKDRIQGVENILNSKKSIQLPNTVQFDSLIIEHALCKKSPFGSKNSMADALIFFSAVEWANSNKSANVVFLTHNTSDFSDKKKDEEDRSHEKRLSSDLQPYVEMNGMKYGIIVGIILNEIEKDIATEEELECEKAVVEYIRTMDDMMSDAAHAFHEQKERYENLIPAAARAMQEQKERYEELSKRKRITRDEENVSDIGDG